MENRLFFFAGGDHNESGGNAFTSTFIQSLKALAGNRFSVIKGIYHPWPVVNVIWALNHAQFPQKNPRKSRIIASSVNQIISDAAIHHSQVTLLSSSYGSVVAAQAACYLAERQLKEQFLSKPFHIALGASMVSKESSLFLKLLQYQQSGIIGAILYDELQDEGDNSNGIGGLTRLEAYGNGLGICFPFLTRKFQPPSFLNKNPVSGHLHRVRAQTVRKAMDFLQVILVDYELGGSVVKEKTVRLLDGKTVRL